MNKGYQPGPISYQLNLFRESGGVDRQLNGFPPPGCISTVSEQPAQFSTTLVLSAGIAVSRSQRTHPDTAGKMPAEGLLRCEDLGSPQTTKSTTAEAFPTLLPFPSHGALFYSTPHSDAVIKPRRRNQYADAIASAKPGPNRFGRKGTLRCEQCRRWRQKAYSSIV
jgi:hypothetical protein